MSIQSLRYPQKTMRFPCCVFIVLGHVITFFWLYKRSQIQTEVLYLGNYEDEPSILIPYAHVVPQLKWIIQNSGNKTILSTGPIPKIYYDRKIIHHLTTNDGCRHICLYTNSMTKLRKGDVAVFSNHFNVSEAKKLRRRGVIIGFESGESPPNMPPLTSMEKQLVSLLLTYHRDSPSPSIYPMFLRNKRPTEMFTQKERDRLRLGDYRHLLPSYHYNRTRLIAWAVSNLHARNNRKEFAEAIATFIPVDIYGSGNKQAPRTEDGFRWIAKNYKFYLAFENSNCRDYITEKLFTNAFSYNMVPIVLGTTRRDYWEFAPPNSYIHVDDFPTIKALTDYLLYLDKNDTAYATYFAWKLEGSILECIRLDCRLCGFMYQLREGQATLQTTPFVYYTDVNKQCFHRKLLPLQ